MRTRVLVKNGFVEFHGGDLWGSADSLLVEADLVQAVPELLHQLNFSYCT